MRGFLCGVAAFCAGFGVTHSGVQGGVAPLLEQLRSRGYFICKLPPEILAEIVAVRRCMLRLFSGSIAEKDAYRTRQDGQHVLSHPGYLTPAPGWAEFFEVRQSRRDHSYRSCRRAAKRRACGSSMHCALSRCTGYR